MVKIMTIFSTFLNIAIRNILRNWRHSFATFLSMIFGFVAVSLFDGFLKEINFKNTDGFTRRGMLGDVIIQKKDATLYLEEDFWRYTLSKFDQEKLEIEIQKSGLVQNHVKFLQISGMMNTGEHSAIFVGFGYDVLEGATARGNGWEWNTVAGIPLQMGPKDSLLIGTDLGKKLACTQQPNENFMQLDGHYKPEIRPYNCENTAFILSSTTARGQINTINLNVIGLIDGGLREYNKVATHIPLPMAQKLLDTTDISMMTVQLKDPSDALVFSDMLKKNLDQQGVFVEAAPWKRHKMSAFVRNVEDLLKVFRNLFMSIIVLIVAMSVSTTMAKSVNERIRELGTLRSFGFTKTQLKLMISIEGFLIAIISCLLGLIVTIVLGFLITKLGIEYRAGILSMPVVLRVKLAPEMWLWTGLLIVALATLSSWWASKKAFRSTIADALIHI